MLLNLRLRAGGSLFLLWVVATGCTINSTTAAADTCSVDSGVVCAAGTTGYSCTGQAPPTAGDSSLSCGSGITESDGATDYCCVSQVASGCAVDTAAGCTADSTGYSCTGADAPSVLDPSLACGAGVAGTADDTLYCCVGVSSGSCAPDASVAGCTGGSYGFSCTSSDTPTAADASLDCSTPASGPNGTLLYCCVGFASSSCTADSTVAGCTGNSFGFSCTSTDTPDQAQPSLVCSTPANGPNDELLYCCSNN